MEEQRVKPFPGRPHEFDWRFRFLIDAIRDTIAVIMGDQRQFAVFTFDSGDIKPWLSIVDSVEKARASFSSASLNIISLLVLSKRNLTGVHNYFQGQIPHRIRCSGYQTPYFLSGEPHDADDVGEERGRRRQASLYQR